MAYTLAEYALCRPEDVKAALSNSEISSFVDDTLVFFINGFSKMIEGPKYCNREFTYKTRTQYFDGLTAGLEYPRRRLFLVSTPVDRDAELIVWDDVTRQWTDSAKLVLWEDYRMDYDNGIITLWEGSQFNADFNTIRVDYTGGIVSDVEHGGMVPDDLRMACAVQCAHWYRTANDPGAQQIQGMGGGGITFAAPTKILPNVREVLETYRRHVY